MADALEGNSASDHNNAGHGNGGTSGIGGINADGGESATMPQAILAALSAGGAFHARQLMDAAKRIWNETAEPDINPETGEIIPQEWSEQQFKDALWSLVWQGKVTNSSFAPVRALAASVGGQNSRRKATVSRRRGRVAPIRRATTDMTLSGLWSLTAADPTDDDANAQASETAQSMQAQQALALVEVLLDRYGVIAQPLIDQEKVPGGFSALYPLLKRMEEHGRLVRGMFVRGFGAAQFAERETVDALRHPLESREQTVVALSVLDPANLSGAAISWPQVSAEATKPTRRAGSLVVLSVRGPLLYATVKSKHLTAFETQSQADAIDDETTGANIPADAMMRKAAAELAYALQRASTGAVAAGSGSATVTFSDINGEPLNARHPFARTLHQAGFVPVPQGMRLY
ncbi:Lhr family helicase [Bifidobacterium colobi]